MKERFSIVYEDDILVVVNKHAALACQGGVGVRTHLVSLLTARYGDRPHLLHRIDKDSSGLVCALKAGGGQSPLAAYYEGFAWGNKFYRLIVKGSFKKKVFTYYSRRETKNKIQATATTYRVLHKFAKYTYLEAKLITGREHQLRRDMAELAHPILGDRKYGDFSLNAHLDKQLGKIPLYLLAYKLTWGGDKRIHPYFRKKKFTVPLTAVFQTFLSRYNIPLD